MKSLFMLRLNAKKGSIPSLNAVQVRQPKKRPGCLMLTRSGDRLLTRTRLIVALCNLANVLRVDDEAIERLEENLIICRL